MKVVPGIHALSQEQGGHVGAFLIDDGQSLTLIDTLFDADGKLILDEIAAMGRQPRDLKNIIVTHAHRSHLGGLAALKKLTNATVYAHDWEAGIVNGSRKATRVSAVPKPPYEVYKLQLGLALGLGAHTPCQVDKPLKDADTIGPLAVVATPGHTPGCLSFHWKEKKALFVGDVIVTWPIVEPGWAGLTLDMKQNIQSVGKLSVFNDVEIIGVGHGPVVTERGAEILNQLKDRKP